MKAGKRLIFTGILVYPLALIMCLMLARGSATPISDNQRLLLLIYLIATFPLAIIVAGMMLLQKDR
ncbi:MAG: hypothetical protein IVW54_02015 [Candidatus Binataceae bacterium]|nr:hypothetical protein [Candidatus Binataceae bacterium]